MSSFFSSFAPRDRRLRSWNVQHSPSPPAAFVQFFIGNFKGWYLAILLLQIAAVVSTILIPWGLGQITRTASNGLAAQNAFAVLQWPLTLFGTLLVCEMLFARAAAGCHIHVLPLQRRTVTHVVYAYLQQHSHRFISNEFAGALAHRVSEVS